MRVRSKGLRRAIRSYVQRISKDIKICAQALKRYYNLNTLNRSRIFL